MTIENDKIEGVGSDLIAEAVRRAGSYKIFRMRADVLCA